MNSNKKDVNDYFKYLRLYYIELAKKRKKELEEKKKKQLEIDIKRKKEEELNIKKIINNTPNKRKVIKPKKTTSKWLTTNVQKMFKLSVKELQVKPTKQYCFRQSC